MGGRGIDDDYIRSRWESPITSIPTHSHSKVDDRTTIDDEIKPVIGYPNKTKDTIESLASEQPDPRTTSDNTRKAQAPSSSFADEVYQKVLSLLALISGAKESEETKKYEDKSSKLVEKGRNRPFRSQTDVFQWWLNNMKEDNQRRNEMTRDEYMELMQKESAEKLYMYLVRGGDQYFTGAEVQTLLEDIADDLQTMRKTEEKQKTLNLKQNAVIQEQLDQINTRLKVSIARYGLQATISFLVAATALSTGGTGSLAIAVVSLMSGAHNLYQATPEEARKSAFGKVTHSENPQVQKTLAAFEGFLSIMDISTAAIAQMLPELLNIAGSGWASTLSGVSYVGNGAIKVGFQASDIYTNRQKDLTHAKMLEVKEDMRTNTKKIEKIAKSTNESMRCLGDVLSTLAEVMNRLASENRQFSRHMVASR